MPSCQTMVVTRPRKGVGRPDARKSAVSKKHLWGQPFNVGAMNVSLSTVHILVDDPDAALAFYRDTLGLTVRFEVANDGFRWITLGTDSQPEIQIVLSQPHAGRSQEDGDAFRPCSPRARCTRCTSAPRISMPPSKKSRPHRAWRCFKSP